MPLSEHEQRLLEQIERALYAEDPKFASTVRASDPRVKAKRRFFVSIATFVLGIGLLLFGVVSNVTVASIPVIGVLGFLVMFGSAVLAVTSYKRMSGREPLRVVGGEAAKKGPAKRSSLFDRMEDRWRGRDENRGL